MTFQEIRIINQGKEILKQINDLRLMITLVIDHMEIEGKILLLEDHPKPEVDEGILELMDEVRRFYPEFEINIRRRT